MRLSVFVSEMKIPTIPQEKMNQPSPEIRPNAELQEAAKKRVNLNYYYRHLMTFKFIFTFLDSYLYDTDADTSQWIRLFSELLTACTPPEIRPDRGSLFINRDI